MPHELQVDGGLPAEVRRVVQRGGELAHAAADVFVTGISDALFALGLVAAGAAVVLLFVIKLLRSHDASAPGPDRFLSPEIEAVVGLVRSGAVLSVVEEAIGELA